MTTRVVDPTMTSDMPSRLPYLDVPSGLIKPANRAPILQLGINQPRHDIHEACVYSPLIVIKRLLPS